MKSTVREALSHVLGPFPLKAPGLIPEFFRAYNTLSGDPDVDLPQWLHTGAPLGILRPITSRGVFPSVEGAPPTTPLDTEALEVDPHGWENYRSAESDPVACATIL
jgi:hypothetical protein